MTSFQGRKQPEFIRFSQHCYEIDNSITPILQLQKRGTETRNELFEVPHLKGKQGSLKPKFIIPNILPFPLISSVHLKSMV